MSAVGGVGGAALGAIEKFQLGWLGCVAGLRGLAAGYCWAHGDGDEDGDGVPDGRDGARAPRVVCRSMPTGARLSR